MILLKKCNDESAVIHPRSTTTAVCLPACKAKLDRYMDVDNRNITKSLLHPPANPLLALFVCGSASVEIPFASGCPAQTRDTVLAPDLPLEFVVVC